VKMAIAAAPFLIIMVLPHELAMRGMGCPREKPLHHTPASRDSGVITMQS
jgi:hypothetical protein